MTSYDQKKKEIQTNKLKQNVMGIFLNGYVLIKTLAYLSLTDIFSSIDLKIVRTMKRVSSKKYVMNIYK